MNSKWQNLIKKCEFYYVFSSHGSASLPPEYEEPLLFLANHTQNKPVTFNDDYAHDELLAVANGEKLVSFTTLFPYTDESHADELQYYFDLAEHLGLKHMESGELYKDLLGRTVVFYNPNNPDSIRTAHIHQWANKESKKVQPEIKWIIFGLIAGYKPEAIKNFITSRTADVEKMNQSIIEYFPSPLASLFV